MIRYSFNLDVVDHSWKACLHEALQQMDALYLEQLMHSHHWLPGPEKIFSAFSLPINHVNYVLFGESPYPRRESANGYAFWDEAVDELWSSQGLSKRVNRATSLRNLIKMLLIAEGLLDAKHPNQEEITRIDKKHLITTNQALFTHLLQQGFLLLNATLVLRLNTSQKQKDARTWLPFIQHVLNYLLQKRPGVKFILLGHIANTIDKVLPSHHFKKIYAEHPYNLSFITNPKILHFFKPLHLLRKN